MDGHGVIFDLGVIATYLVTETSKFSTKATALAAPWQGRGGAR